jgi:hypothetical protein
VDGPTPDYVEPQTGSFDKKAKILAGLGAVMVALAVGVIVLAGSQFDVEREGLALAGREPSLAVRDCELTAVVENLEKNVLTLTGTSVAVRELSDGDFVWREVAGEIPARVFQPAFGKVITARFPVSECVSDLASLLPRGWTISYERADGTTGSSELSLGQ